MEDLSHILISRIPVKDGIPVLPQATMEEFSDAETIIQATRLMGFTETEETDGGS